MRQAKKTDVPAMRPTWWWALAVSLCLAAGLPVHGADAAAAAPEATEAFLEREIRTLSAIPSRLSGTPGCEQAARYIIRRFKEIGLKNVTRHTFDVVVPITKRCSLALGPRKTPVEIHPLWPNWVRTCTTPGPITAPIVYAYDGDFRKLSGLPIRGSIVILEHNSGAAWQNLWILGPRAVLFVEPAGRDATRRQAEMKVLRNPLNAPRFWIPRTGTGARLGARELVRRVQQAQDEARKKKDDALFLTATLDCKVDWELRTAANIIGLLEGTEGTVADGNFVAYSAHYDSISVAPDLAPGADGASSIAGLLRLAERLAAKPGRESVMFIATAGHYQGLRGATVLADVLKWSHTPAEDNELDERIRELREDKIDEASRVRAYERLADDMESTTGFQPKTAEELLAAVKKLEANGPPDAANPRPAYDRLLGLLKKIDDADFIDGEHARELRRVIRELRNPKPGPKTTTLRSGLPATYAGILDQLKAGVQRRLRTVKAVLAQIELLKERIAQTTDSQVVYDEIFRLLESVDDLDAAAQRRLRFRIEHEQDADRHIATYRFELVRLRKHQRFLQQLGIDLKKRLRILYSLDLCSDGWRFGVFAAGAGALVSQTVQEQSIYGALLQSIWQIGRKKLAAAPVAAGEKAALYERIVYPARAEDRLKGGTSGYFSGLVTFDSEMFQLAGREALALVTVDCGRRRVDTPTDTADRIRKYGGYERLGYQVDLLCELAEKLVQDRHVRALYRTFDSKRATDKSPLRDYYCRINGRVVYYDIKRSMGTADQPLGGALCATRYSAEGRWAGKAANSFAGVRDGYLTFSTGAGTYEVLGLPHDRSRPWNMKIFRFEAYRFNTEADVAAARKDGRSLALGEINYAPDLGPQGAQQQFKILQKIDRDDLEVTVAVFACRPVGLIGFKDPLVAHDYKQIILYDAKTNTTPDFYGQSLFPTAPSYTHGVPNAVIYLQPDVRFKLQFTAGALGATFPLINVRGGRFLSGDAAKVGRGYAAVPPAGGSESEHQEPDEAAGILVNCRYLMARDVVNLDQYRIEALRDHAVENRRVNELHAGRKDKDQKLVAMGAVQQLQEAEKALAARDYARFSTHLETAIAMEARAYPIVKGTTTDILTGVMFYLFLLLPFSYFAERLLFGFPSVNKRIVAFFGIFVAVFVVLALVHPAFAITQSAPVILIAFITLALSMLVIMMIRSRFEMEIRRLHERPGARRQGDFKRASATSAACALGIGNMRRRKTRTTLTLVTLVLLTFSVLSFTSVDPRQVTYENPDPTGEQIVPPYPGVLLRTPSYGALSDYVYRLARNEFSGEATVVPRAWLGSDCLIQSAADFRKEFLATGVVGMTPDEAKATRPQTCLLAGRWFQAGEEPGCIIGHGLAEHIGITPQQVKDAKGDPARSPKIRMLGTELPVIGITDDKPFSRLYDVDGEEISPVDRRQESWMKRAGKSFDPYAVESYIHVEPENCVFVPYDFLMEYGANLISVAIVARDSAQAEAIGKNLLNRLTMPIYIASEGSVTYSLSSDANRVRGMGSMIVPMLICALIVLNTMLGSVYERQREISIFGSLGLAPLHIGSLFMAESAVFATIAVILGYVLGQTTSFLLTANNLLEGFSLNYSSISAVISAAAVMALVLLSTIYPARKASQLSVPDVERIWRLPEPDGDHFDIEFPFTIGGEQAYGINMFLLEYFRDHANQSVGDFFAQNSALRLEKIDGADVIRFDSQVWIAPFDFGISQSLSLFTMPTDEEGIFAPEMHLYRKSGTPAAWARMNHRFLKLIRQQFLLWRILSGEEREYFAAQAKVQLGIATDKDREILETMFKGPDAPEEAEEQPASDEEA